MHGVIDAVTSEYCLRTRIDLRVAVMLNERQAINEDIAMAAVSCLSETRNRWRHRGSRLTLRAPDDQALRLRAVEAIWKEQDSRQNDMHFT